MSERMLRQVQAAPTTSFTPMRSGLLQRKCACGNSAGLAGECAECGEHPKLQRHSTGHARASTVPAIVHQVLRSSGQQLDASTRSFMEPRFGHDFSHVRVHNDAKAAESADAVDAFAYTVSNNVVFGAGRYSPGTREGRSLLAHELAHVVQQQQAGSLIRSSAVKTGRAAPAMAVEEQETQEFAAAVKESELENESIGDEGLRLFRQPKKDGNEKGGKKPAAKKKPKSSTLTAAEVKTLITSNNNSSVSTELLLCLIWKESGFDPSEKNSSSSATGLMQMTKGAVDQVNKSTPKGVHFSHSEMTNSAKNIQCGTYYLKIRIEWAKGDVTKGLEGYGTGSGYAANILTCETCIKDPANKTDDCLKKIHS